MALSEEEKATLEALTKKANEPEADDFSIEIWDESGAGAKLPFSQGKSWLARFGIGVDEPASDEGDPKTKKPAAKADDSKPDNVALRHFGKPKAS